MQITFDNPGFDYSIRSILLFQTEEAGDWWRESLCCFYPQVERERVEGLKGAAREAYLRDVLGAVYRSLAPELAEKREACQAHWEENRRAVEFDRRQGFELLEERVDEGTGQPELLMVWRK